MSFVHLHTHSEYSLLDGAARVKDLVARAKSLDMPALALTDHGVMFGAVEFYREAHKAGIKPVIGCEVYFTPNERGRKEGKPQHYHLLLLAKDMAGYRNLMALVSEAHLTGFHYKPQVDLELLERYAPGLIGTSACMSGIVSKSLERGETDQARTWAETYARVFGEGDFYLELQEQGITADNGVTQKQLNAEIARLGTELGLPLVGTNDIHYVEAAHAEAQDMLLCIQTGSNLNEEGRLKFSSDQFYMKCADEMATALSEYPAALASTLEIAGRCEVELEFDRIILPVFEVPGGRSEDEHLRAECLDGLKVRYGDPVPAEALERVENELAVITSKGLSAYFLIVADFVQWAKASGIGVGPGRGSAAGSIIAYALRITDLDPIENGLLFERFLNPERTEMPDIDIDFDDERRGEVIDYVRKKYGEDKVAQIVTFGTMKARAAVRDAGRVLGYPYGVPDKIAKLIPERLNMGSDETKKKKKEIEVALRDSPDLRAEYENNGDAKRILDAAMALEGLVRGEGVHAAGVVICRDPLFHHTPVKRDTKGGGVITQYEGTLIADLGLLKMDFLGLRTLTVIANAQRQIRDNHGVDVDFTKVPMDDAVTFGLLQRGDTDGVFQVESPGMKRVLRDLKPTKFGDIVAVVALYRPGPMDSIPEFINRKHGRTQVTYYDDRVKHILEETYGSIVYQEQAMRISMEMAGFTAAKADKLRKGMGKKIQAIVDALKPEFVEGSVARGYDKRLAEKVWADIEKFGEYAFNKSHAAAYAVLSYQTAYLKAHYPLEFMAAVLTSYTGKSETIVKYVAACNQAGMKVLPPDVNTSRKDFTVVGDNIRFGMNAVRNVGEAVVESVLAAREAGGPFTSLHDFCRRVDLKAMNKRAIETLIKAGAFDSTGYTRKHLLEMMDGCVEAGLKAARDRDSGQVSMFEMFDAEDADHGFSDHVPPANGDEWDKRMKLAFEKEALGIYVSDHPLSEIAHVIEAARTLSLGDQESLRDGASGWFAGIITKAERRATAKGALMGSFTLEDLEGSVEGVLFPQAFDKFRDVMAEDAIVRVRGKVENSDRGLKVIVHEMEALSDDGGFAPPPGQLTVEAGPQLHDPATRRRFKQVLAEYPGKDLVIVTLAEHGTRRVVRLKECVDRESTGLHAALKELLGPDAVA